MLSVRGLLEGLFDFPLCLFLGLPDGLFDFLLFLFLGLSEGLFDFLLCLFLGLSEGLFDPRAFLSPRGDPLGLLTLFRGAS